MTAYVIVNIEVTDEQAYAEVKQLTPPTVHAYGGRYLARGGRTAIFAGDWQPKRLVILQFDSMEQVERWQDSPEYADVRIKRDRCARVQMVALESGVEPPV